MKRVEGWRVGGAGGKRMKQKGEILFKLHIIIN